MLELNILPKGTKVRFIGHPCGRTEGAGLKVGDIITVVRQWRGRYIFEENDLLLLLEDVEEL
jgi:hypothetical protein